MPLPRKDGPVTILGGRAKLQLADFGANSASGNAPDLAGPKYRTPCLGSFVRSQRPEPRPRDRQQPLPRGNRGDLLLPAGITAKLPQSAWTAFRCRWTSVVRGWAHPPHSGISAAIPSSILDLVADMDSSPPSICACEAQMTLFLPSIEPTATINGPVANGAAGSSWRGGPTPHTRLRTSRLTEGPAVACPLAAQKSAGASFDPGAYRSSCAADIMAKTLKLHFGGRR